MVGQIETAALEVKEMAASLMMKHLEWAMEEQLEQEGELTTEKVKERFQGQRRSLCC